MNDKKGFFTRFAGHVSNAAGSPYAFIGAATAVVLWGASGPLFGFSDTWQLVINTSTTIITFLMVFVIQSSQNSDTHAMQLKLDELLRVTEGAHNALLDLEELSDKDLLRIREKYECLARLAREQVARGEVDTAKPDIILFD